MWCVWCNMKATSDHLCKECLGAPITQRLLIWYWLCCITCTYFSIKWSVDCFTYLTLEIHPFFFSSKMHVWRLWDDDHFAGGRQAERPKPIIKPRVCLQAAELFMVEHIPCNIPQLQLSACSNAKQAPCGENKFVTQIDNIHHKQESTDSSFDKGHTDICLRCSWPTAHRSIFSEFLCPCRTAQECRQHPAHKQKLSTGRTRGKSRASEWALKLKTNNSPVNERRSNM